jgi:hypothetical protein
LVKVGTKSKGGLLAISRRDLDEGKEKIKTTLWIFAGPIPSLTVTPARTATL